MIKDSGILLTHLQSDVLHAVCVIWWDTTWQNWAFIRSYTCAFFRQWQVKITAVKKVYSMYVSLILKNMTLIRTGLSSSNIDDILLTTQTILLPYTLVPAGQKDHSRALSPLKNKIKAFYAFILKAGFLVFRFCTVVKLSAVRSWPIHLTGGWKEEREKN